MEVGIPRRKMGPERIFPNPNEDQGDQRAPEGFQENMGNWSGEEPEEEEEEQQLEDDDEEEHEGSYFYQPLNQDPEHGAFAPMSQNEHAAGGHYSHLEATEDGLDPAEEPGVNIEERLQEMRLHLPNPPVDSDDEDGASSPNSRTSIPMDPAHVELVKRTMAGIQLPSLGVPPWAAQISDEQWKDMVELTLQSHVTTAGSAVVWH